MYEIPTLELQELISLNLIVRRIVTRGKPASIPIPPHQPTDVDCERVYKEETVNDAKTDQCNFLGALEQKGNQQDATDVPQDHIPEHPDEPRDELVVDRIGFLVRIVRACNELRSMMPIAFDVVRVWVRVIIRIDSKKDDEYNGADEFNASATNANRIRGKSLLR